LRFLCDEMVASLGRWLRAAGYDTGVMAHRAHDRAVVERALAENRHILTRDRKILEIKGAAARTLLLRGNATPRWAGEVSAAFAIDWLRAPFTRCLVCNRELAPLPDELRPRLPPRLPDETGPLTWCPACDKIYWPGSHVRRMTARLEAWQRGEFI